MSQREFEHGFLQVDNSTTDDKLKQMHIAARWTSLTEGHANHYNLESEVGDQRVDA